MKRWQSMLIIGCALLITWSGAALAQPTDVAPGHWAYRAVQTLIDRGYMDVESDGAFSGETPVERYDLAVVLARLLSDIEQGKVQVTAGTDAEMLRELEREFRQELVQWYAERDELEAAYGQTQRRLGVIDEQLNSLLVALDDLHDSLRSDMASSLAAETLRTDELFETVNERIATLQQLVMSAFGEYDEAVEAQFEDQLAVITSLRRDMDALLETVADELYASLHALADDVDVQQSTLEAMGQRIDRVNDNAAALAFRLNELEEQLAARVVTLETDAGAYDERLGALEAEIARLHDVMGTSEEQIARMTERVRLQLDDQLALSLSRERQLERKLRDLEEEFAGYKARSDEEIRSARSTGTMALGAAAVAVLLALLY